MEISFTRDDSSRTLEFRPEDSTSAESTKEQNDLSLEKQSVNSSSRVKETRPCSPHEAPIELIESSSEENPLGNDGNTTQTSAIDVVQIILEAPNEENSLEASNVSNASDGHVCSKDQIISEVSEMKFTY